MSELMLINPGRRVKKRKKSKRTLRAKRRKMSPLQLKYFGKKSQRTTVMAKKRRTKKRRHNPVATLAANPKRRHRRLSAKRRHNPIRARRRRRHNPLSLGKFSVNSFMKQTLMPSAIGAAGALGLDMILSKLPLPDSFKTSTMKPLVRIAGAVAMGMLAGAVTNRRMAEQLTAGAVTVVLYDTLKEFMVANVPAVAPALAGLGAAYDYDTLGYAGAGSNAGMGEYVSGMGMYFDDSHRVSTM